MVKFEIAKSLTDLNEGGIALDPKDPGGVTYMGIAYNYNPTWSGWKIVLPQVKTGKNKQELNRIFKKDKELQELVDYFYEIHYWNYLLLNHFDSQEIANEVYDTSINCGKYHGIIFLQRSLNMINPSIKPVLLEDGKMGDNTLMELLSQKNKFLILKLLNIYQGDYYLDLIKSNPSKYKRYLNSWLSRVEIRQKNN